MVTLWDVRSIVNVAKNTIYDGDEVVRDIACLAAGRLRLAAVDADILRAFKSELESFNGPTGKWKGES